MAPSRPHTSRRDRLHNKRALSHQIELHANIESLINDVRGGRCNINELLSKLLTAQEDIEGIEAHFKRTLEPIIYNERRASDSTIAERTLNIPELLELVLAYVGFVDLLNMTQVSRTIRANMDGSPRLQKMLCLKAAEPNDGILHCPFAGCLGVNGGFRFRVKKKTSTFTASFLTYPTKQLPAIGPLWRKRFICQPPVMGVEAHVTCCPPSAPASNGTTHVRTIDSKSGITIGDLYDLTEELVVQHKDCEYSRVCFKGYIQV